MKLLLLHGAIGASEQLTELKTRLSRQFDVVCPDLPGHGKDATAGDYSIKRFADWLLKKYSLDNEPVNIVGYSMGGYIAMYIARHYPNMVNKVVTLATKYEWTAPIAANEIKMLDPEKISLKIPAFATTLEKRHEGIGWKSVLAKTAKMMVEMGDDPPLKNDDYRQIAARALIAIGDRDKMVSLTETTAVYQAMPNAALFVLPGMGHPIEQIDNDLFIAVVEKFLSEKKT